MKHVFKSTRLTIAYTGIIAIDRENHIVHCKGDDFILNGEIETTSLEKAWLQWLENHEGEVITGENQPFLYSPAAFGNAGAMVGELAASVQNKGLYDRYQAEIVQAFFSAWNESNSAETTTACFTRAAKTFLDNLKPVETEKQTSRLFEETLSFKTEEPAEGGSFEGLHKRLADFLHSEFLSHQHSKDAAQAAAKTFLDDLFNPSFAKTLANRIQEDWFTKYAGLSNGNEALTKAAALKVANTLMDTLLGK